MSCTDIPEYNFVIRQGDDKTVYLRYLADSAPVDIAGALILFECANPTLSQEATIDDAALGKFHFDFARADTAILTERRLKYEVVIYPSGLSGTKETLFYGSVNITPQVI